MEAPVVAKTNFELLQFTYKAKLGFEDALRLLPDAFRYSPSLQKMGAGGRCSGVSNECTFERFNENPDVPRDSRMTLHCFSTLTVTDEIVIVALGIKIGPLGIYDDLTCSENSLKKDQECRAKMEKC